MKRIKLVLFTMLTTVMLLYNAFNVYRRELAPGTVSLTGDRAQGDDSKHWAYSNNVCLLLHLVLFTNVNLRIENKILNLEISLPVLNGP